MEHTVSLTSNRAFQRLYKKGKSAVSPCLALYCRETRRRCTRLGLTVGTKLGKAVVRNKIRRRLKEAYRLHEHEFRPGLELVIVARARAVRAPYRELERNLLRAAGKLGLLVQEDKP